MVSTLLTLGSEETANIMDMLSSLSNVSDITDGIECTCKQGARNPRDQKGLKI